MLLLAVASDAFEVMLLPRRVRRQLRPVRYVFKLSWAFWRLAARRMPKTGIGLAFLSAYGPFSMVLLLSLWAVGLVISFGILHWAVGGNPDPRSLLTDLYLSGATFFTLGYGDVLPRTPINKALAVVESGVGLAFIAATIGYLPVLYQLFSRREARIIQLDTRAGSPPTAATLLTRHGDFEALTELDAFLRDSEQWCAELIESHLSYPMLSYYRSLHDNQSWLAALTVTLDVCAVVLTGVRGVATFQSRSTFGMARLAALELCRVFHLRLPKEPKDRTGEGGFNRLSEALTDSGLPFSDVEDAENRLNSFRLTYEPYLAALSRHFLLALPPWFADEQKLDNWQRSRGGREARELIENTRAKPE